MSWEHVLNANLCVCSSTLTNSSDVFHQFFPRIFLSLSSWKRNQTSYWSQTFVFLSLPVGKRNYIQWLFIRKIRRFGIWDWWNYLMNSLHVLCYVIILTTSVILCVRFCLHVPLLDMGQLPPASVIFLESHFLFIFK